ncbi:hypothetical protein BD410DRAFT_902999, partial [Rickenella mellea]
MTYSVASSMSFSVHEHPPVHNDVDIEDASKAAYNFVKSTFKSDISVSATQGVSNDLNANLAQIRAEIDSVNRQLHISNLHVETLRQALDLSRDAQASFQTQHAELLNYANKLVEQSGYVIQLPQDVISHIASILYWNAEEEWGIPGPHYEWVATVYRTASEPVRFKTDSENQIRLTKGRSAALTDGERPLSIRFDSFSGCFAQSEDVSENSHQHLLFSTTRRWRGLYLDVSARCDVLNHCLAGLPTLTLLSVYYNGPTQHDSSTPLPTWWGGFVERFGRAGRTSPVLRVASVPLRFLTTSGGLFSNLSHLLVQVDAPINYSSSELSSTLRSMPHLSILKILLWFQFESLDIPTSAKNDQVIKLPFLKDFMVGGIGMGLPILSNTVAAFECESLQVFCAELFEPISRPRPEEIANLLNLVHDSFPTLEELFVQIPPTELNSQSVTRNLSVPKKDGYWLLPNLTTLAIPFVLNKSILRALVALGHNRRKNEVSARIMYLKFIPSEWTRTQESNDILRSLLINYHDVEVLKWSNP